jgi:hypothetical protein
MDAERKDSTKTNDDYKDLNEKHNTCCRKGSYESTRYTSSDTTAQRQDRQRPVLLTGHDQQEENTKHNNRA